MPKGCWFKIIIVIAFLLQITPGADSKALGNQQLDDPSCPIDAAFRCPSPKSNYFIDWNQLFSTTTGSNHCQRMYILDLSAEFTSEEQFNSSVKYFLKYSLEKCFQERIGETVTIAAFSKVVYDDATSEYDGFLQCSSQDDCNQLIENLNYQDFIIDYSNGTELLDLDPAYSADYSNNFSILLKYYQDCPCRYNSAVLLTSRIVDFKHDRQVNYTEITVYACIELSIMLMGRNETTATALLDEYYGYIVNVTVLNVPDYNCVNNLLDCIPPCNSESAEECGEKRLDSCSILTTTTTTTTTTSIPPTDSFESREFVYVLMFSTNVKQENLSIILDSLIEPIQDSNNQSHHVTSKIVVSESESSSVYRDPLEFQKYLEGITVNRTEIKADVYDTEDNEMVNRINAMLKYNPHGVPNPSDPFVIIMTDYFSTKFAKFYKQPDTMNCNSVACLNRYYHDFYIYNSLAYEYYKNNSFAPYHLTLVEVGEKVSITPFSTPSTTKPTTTTTTPEPNNGSTASDTTTTAGKPDDRISEKTVIIIIFGAIFGALAILCTCSFLYRQRMSWKTKLENIRANHHKRDEEATDVRIDYWELTWDKLLVKSEKLGSGAFGQVLRGKIIGKPPCYENFYENLQVRNLSQMENTDVAIKMLPKYADEAAKKEFMNEIELMKLIGYHDNIVNMLGCVTVGHPMCLVLEFCPFRDLLQYVKARKVEVSISNSLEEKINHTKDFLIFAWQIAQGMKFLACKSIIHRDLAARNVLIDADKNAKISDFGLCVQTTDKLTNAPSNDVLVSASGRLPIKWLAIESLKNHEFSLKSDVWAFGIVLYEMYSFGEIPFNKVEPKNLLEHLEGGNRPEKPELCSQETYDIMLNCWNENPGYRPSFEELLTVFTVFLERSTEGYGYLPLLRSETTANTNEITQKLAQNINPAAAEPPIPRKTVRQRLTSESNKLFSFFKSSSGVDKNTTPDDAEDYGSGLTLQIPPLTPGGPPYSAGVEQIRPRFTSVRSESYASLNDIDPGVEMRNGRPRLRNNNPSESLNSSVRKSSTFHLGDLPQKGSERKNAFFQKFL